MFGDPASWPDQDGIGVSAELTGPMLVEAYASGVFPMPYDGVPGARFAWYSPVQRGILPLDRLRVSDSLRRNLRRYTVTVDTAFEQVVRACADPAREDGWIDEDIVAAYTDLHGLGLAHSVETRTPDGALVGGLYGVALNGLFAGESMFHDRRRGRDASKVALVHLVRILGGAPGPRLLDVQWRTDHLASLGVIEVPRAEYLRRLDAALDAPPAPWEAWLEAR